MSYSSEFISVDVQEKIRVTTLSSVQTIPCPYIPKLFAQGIMGWYNPDSERDEVEIEFDLSNASSVCATLEKLKITSYSLAMVEQYFNQNDLQELILYAPNLFRLSIIETCSDNNILKHLNMFIHVQHLDISDNRFDDDGFYYISSLSELLDLRMVYNKITSRGIKHLSSLRKLRSLDAGCTYLGNEGIEILSSTCSQLTILDVRACGFDDEALSSLESMPNLKRINISSNKISEQGLKKFIQATSTRGIEVIANELYQ